MSHRPAYLRAEAVADLLGLSVRTIRRWIADRSIPSAKIGGARLVAFSDLERLLSGPRDADMAASGDEEPS
jgi:excisionase family DNA binding protein